MTKSLNEILLSDLSIIDLRDPEQLKCCPLNGDKYLAEGRTHIIFDGNKGTIYMAVENGNLIFIDPIKNVLDPESSYQKFQLTKTEDND